MCVFVSTAFSQNTLPRFTTASVTPTDERVHHMGASAFVVSGQRIDGHSVPVGALVTEGWRLHPYQIIWPVQALDALYNVSATMPKGTTPEIRGRSCFSNCWRIASAFVTTGRLG